MWELPAGDSWLTLTKNPVCEDAEDAVGGAIFCFCSRRKIESLNKGTRRTSQARRPYSVHRDHRVVAVWAVRLTLAQTRCRVCVCIADKQTCSAGWDTRVRRIGSEMLAIATRRHTTQKRNDATNARRTPQENKVTKYQKLRKTAQRKQESKNRNQSRNKLFFLSSFLSSSLLTTRFFHLSPHRFVQSLLLRLVRR